MRDFCVCRFRFPFPFPIEPQKFLNAETKTCPGPAEGAADWGIMLLLLSFMWSIVALESVVAAEVSPHGIHFNLPDFFSRDTLYLCIK